MDRLNVVDGAIRPVWSGCGLVGRAVTVVTAGGDNRVIHEAISDLRNGDVLVVNGQGVTNRALVGELISERAQRKGCVGFVIDGAIRDADEIAELRFPVYARGVTPAGPYRNGPGHNGVPVAVGGVVVQPGDWVIGDSDGVAVVPHDQAHEILDKAEAKRDAELQQQRDIRAH
ncbi:methyltransferase [Brevibacterium luteolum]|uniref:RraA family protein n=1 Tax=Brevibacterium luteolum TaxID=199591 RepID=UPI00223C074B|nr:methyltransferase [Brevibacterium luteolum]MCT1655804.1 methyltransferase [Brevibacterium luteolum]